MKFYRFLDISGFLKHVRRGGKYSGENFSKRHLEVLFTALVQNLGRYYSPVLPQLGP